MESLLGQFRDVMVVPPTDKVADNRSSDAAEVRNATHALSPGLTVSPFVGRAAEGAGLDDEDDETDIIRLLDEVNQKVFRNNDEDAAESPAGGFATARTSDHTPHGSRMMYTAPSPPQSNSPYTYASTAPQRPFAEAVATTPLLTAVPMELSPLTAHYIPPMPAAQQDPILLRNSHGIFMLHPVPKPTPPYTPPGIASPMSPPPRYTLPPAAHTQSQPHFLGSSLAQVGGLTDMHAPKKAGGSPYNASHAINNGIGGGSHVMGGGSSAGTYTYVITSVKSKSSGHLQPPPPPYPST